MKTILLLSLLGLLVSCSAAARHEPAGVTAGAARVDITPDVPTPYNLGVEEIAREVVHPLYARILYLEDDDDRVLVVAVDWEGLLRTAHDHLRQAVSEATGVPVGNIVVNASHSHDSMWINLDTEDLLAEWGYHLVDGPYFRAAVEKIAAGAKRAIAEKRSARFSAGSGSLPELATNHRVGYVKREDRERLNRKRAYPIGITDPTLGVVRVDDDSGRPIAVLHVFAAHATISAGRDVISGSFPGAAMRDVEKELGGGCVAIFLQGCGGNISPGAPTEPSPAAVDRAGRIFADRALEVLGSSMRPLESDRFAFGFRNVKLPLVPLAGHGSLEALERRFRETATSYKARRERGRRGSYEALVALGDRLTLARNHEAWSRYDLQALRWGRELCLVFLPGEVFVEYALEIRERIGEGSVFVAAYNDCTPVYIPDPVAFEEGGYEVGPWCYSTPETGKVMVDAVLRLVAALRP